MNSVKIINLHPNDFPSLNGTHYFPLKRRSKPNLPVYKITGYYLKLGEEGGSEIKEIECEAHNEQDAIRISLEEGLETTWMVQCIEGRRLKLVK